jgi:hypothetical protein
MGETMRSAFGPGTIVLGGGAGVLVLFLAVGFLLPSEWASAASDTLEATDDEILRLLDSPEGWQTWTTWPDSGLTRSGPDRGAGAAISWDDREVGSGSFTIRSVAPDVVTYTVEVAGAGGAVMRTIGSVTLSSEGDGTRVLWEESGDLGRNPLMGFWALSMERAQGTEMGKGLDRLNEVVLRARGTAEQEAPADSSSTGAY